MRIGDVSKELDIPSATLRYYEQIGLLGNIKKKSGIRDYSEEDIERLKFIVCMKKAGFPLDAIVTFLNLYQDKEHGEEKRLEMLLKQKETLLKEMKEKKEILDFLNYKIDLYTKKVKKQS